MAFVTDEQLLAIAREHERTERFADAEAIYRSLLARYPGSGDLHQAIGVIAHREGRLAEAHEWLRRAIALDPHQPLYFSNLGAILQALGDLPGAIENCERALKLDPRLRILHYNLGCARLALGQWDTAAEDFRLVLKEMPGHADSYLSLGHALLRKGDKEGAVGVYRVALSLMPNHSALWNNLGNALQALGDWEGSVAAYREALLRNPSDAYAANNLGDALLELGQASEAIEWFRRSIEARPQLATAHSNLVFALQLLPEAAADEIAAEAQRWWLQHGAPLVTERRPFYRERLPERPLRIGYVSNDLRDHPVGRHLLAVLPLHDRARFEVTIYSDARVSDPIHSRLRDCGFMWRESGAWSDERLAVQIRKDAIDVLVDLSLHSAGNRLLVFARQPAPVQVSFAGYPGSTGLETIRFRITDRFLEPPSEASPWRGEAVRLPDSFWCFDPLEETPPVTPLPCLEKGEFVFGCLSKTSKINDRTLGWWSEILHRVPDSRLLLLCTAAAARERIASRFEALGIVRERIRFSGRLPRHDYLALYQGIDLVLDSYPYNGHVTTCDALWMGVPVISLAGETPVSRGGRSALCTIGLPELVADSPEEYIQLATELATNRPRLAALRGSLRERMQSSPLMDRHRYAKALDWAYRAMWREWCETPPQPLAADDAP